MVLSDSRGRLVDRVVIDNLAKDCSYGRDANGNWTVFQTATPGLPNNQTGMNQMDRNMIAMNSTGVYITEVMGLGRQRRRVGKPHFGLGGALQLLPVRGGFKRLWPQRPITRARKWQFPSGTVIQPGEYKIVLLDGKSDQTTTSELHTSFKLLRVGGEVICLSDPSGKILDKINLPLIPTNISYGRTTGLSGFFYYDTPTPAAANGTGFIGYAQTPELTTAPGLYYNTVATTITIPENCLVYYTTDGSTPPRIPRSIRAKRWNST